MSYANAKSTELLATSCLCCGRELRDATSVETGIGPVCREKHGFNEEIPNEARITANKLVHEAALGSTDNERKLAIADEVEALGLVVLADKIRERFLNAAVEISTQTVTFGKGKWAKELEAFVVSNRWCPEFTEALKAGIDWRDRTVLRNEKGKFAGWSVKPSAKHLLWDLVKAHFGGERGLGPKGVFEIPHSTSA